MRPWRVPESPLDRPNILVQLDWMEDGCRWGSGFSVSRTGIARARWPSTWRSRRATLRRCRATSTSRWREPADLGPNRMAGTVRARPPSVVDGRSWRLWPQINDETATANPETDQRIFERRNHRQPEKAKRCDRSHPHDPADPRTDVLASRSIDELPDQKHVRGIYEEEDGCIERHRLRCELAYGHPTGGQRKQ